MAKQKIRLGIIGANVHVGWASRSHLPAAAALSDFELTGVCTTKAESAEAAKKKYGARLAFHDYRTMLAHPDIDAVAVVLRVPAHYEHTMAALDAGKHVYCEWPLGRTTTEAEQMAAKARTKGLRCVVGLQARVEPTLMHMRSLITAGQIGEVLSANLVLVREGILSRPEEREWQWNESRGAHTLTIANGHSIDALRFVLGEFAEVQATVATRITDWTITDAKRIRSGVTSPDTVSISGSLVNGAVVSAHVSHVPFAGSAYRMAVYGSKGTLVASGADSPQMARIKLEAALGDNMLREMETPAEFVHVTSAMPTGLPFNVGQLYGTFGEAIRSGHNLAPDFDTAVSLHRLIDAMRQSSRDGVRVKVNT